MSEIIKLDGNIRTELGSSFTKKLRKVGRLPAVIYSNDAKENICIDIDVRAFERELEKKNITTKIFEIKTPKKTFKLVISEISYDPISDRPKHVDFISLEGKKEVKVFVPVVFTNGDKSAGLKRGGFLNILKRKLHLLCDVKKIPSKIEIDISNLKLKQSIYSSNIKLPDGVKFVNKKDSMIVNIIGRGKKDEDESKKEGQPNNQTTPAATTTKQPTATAKQTPAAKPTAKK
jgi:large subunit ribosomal protein L25